MLFSTDILFHWLDNTAQLSQRVCVVLIAAYVAIRIDWLRAALRGNRGQWRNRLIAILFFSLFAIIGTHSGLLLDVHHVERHIAWPTNISDELKRFQAVIGFRDLMVIAAGLTGGPWVGLGTGALAGGERYLLGGFAGTASALATVCQGLLAGLALHWHPKWAVQAKGAGLLAVLGTAISGLLLLSLVHPYQDALILVSEICIPVIFINTFGVLLFLFVMQDLERDLLKNQAQKAELRAWNAQIEPHFMNGAITAIKVQISENPSAAEDYLTKLARFLTDTRENASANSITLESELIQVKRYLDIQKLRFPGVFHYFLTIPPELLPYHIPPRSLQSLAENALLHGMKSRTGDLEVAITAKDNGNTYCISIDDNGGGIAPTRLAELGKRTVPSANGNGTGLYHLQKSLELAFPERAGQPKLFHICCHTNPDYRGTKVILNLPKRSQPW